ncbi:MAG: hypothetical protein OEZ06_12525 [Myxococcales bacterium]|nr:hypothetical protein [Myxococcales bacterium]
MKRWTPALAALVVLGLGYLWLLGPSAPRRSAASGAVEPSEDEAELAEAQPAPAAVPRPPRPAKAPAEGAEQAPEPPPPPAWKPRGNPATVLYPAFEREPRDALWADATEREIRELLDDPQLPEDVIESVSCRTTVCRLQLRWWREGDQGLRRSTELITGRFAPTIGIDYPTVPEAKRAVDYYFPRKGYTLEDVAGGADEP